MNIESILERKRELENQIEYAKVSVWNLPNLSGRWSEVADWRLRMNNLLAQHGNDMQRVMKTRGADYSQMKSTIERLTSGLQHEEKIAKDAKKQLADLEAELATLDIQVSLKELLDLQAKMMEAEQALLELEKAVSAEQTKINGTTGSTSQVLAELAEEKENLLAEIASGSKVDKGQLESIEKRMAEAESAHDEYIDSTITASQTINGLNRKIESASEELSLAKSNFIDAAICLLESEIELAGSDYVKLAEQCSTSFMRVVALGEICSKLGKPIKVFGSYTATCQIPSFALRSCRGKELQDYPGMLFKYRAYMSPDALLREVERLKEMGLALPL